MEKNTSTQITKKKEISLDKALAQMDMLLPNERKEPAKEAIRACKDVRKYRVINFMYLSYNYTTQGIN